LRPFQWATPFPAVLGASGAEVLAVSEVAVSGEEILADLEVAGSGVEILEVSEKQEEDSVTAALVQGPLGDSGTEAPAISEPLTRTDGEATRIDPMPREATQETTGAVAADSIRVELVTPEGHLERNWTSSLECLPTQDSAMSLAFEEPEWARHEWKARWEDLLLLLGEPMSVTCPLTCVPCKART